MGIGEILLLSLGVSLDALATSVSGGICDPARPWRNGLMAAFFFGGFQFLMPLLGWGCGMLLQDVLQSFDHYAAFGLLALVGGKILYDALHKAPEREACPKRTIFCLSTMLILAVATSLDALAIGASIAMIGGAILTVSLAMGIVTGAVSLGGVLFGKLLGRCCGKAAEITAGTVIILIGVKILVEHVMA